MAQPSPTGKTGRNGQRLDAVHSGKRGFWPARDPSLTRVAAFGAAKIGAVTAAISTFSTPRELGWMLGRRFFAGGAGRVVAQLNPELPWSEGDTMVEAEAVDLLVPRAATIPGSASSTSTERSPARGFLPAGPATWSRRIFPTCQA